MSGFDFNNVLNKSGRLNKLITESDALSKTGKLGANQGNYTHVDIAGNLNPPQSTTPPTIDYSQTSYVFNQNDSVNLCPTIVAQSPYSIAVSPALPNNLSLDSSTGCITGTADTVTSLTNYTFTITDPNGTGTDTLNIEILGSSGTLGVWYEVNSNQTLDLKAMYPNATSFDIIAIGGGGGGVGGFIRAVTSNSMFAQSGGGAGAVSRINVLSSTITNPLSFNIGVGGAGGLGGLAGGTSAYYMGFKGKDGGNSFVAQNGTNIVLANGGKGISNQSNNSLFPFAAVGTLYNGSTVQGASGTGTTTVGTNGAVEASTGFSNSTFKTVGANVPAWTVVAQSSGHGGVSAGMANNATAYQGQNGQASTNNSVVGIKGVSSSTVNGTNGTDGTSGALDITNGIAKMGTGGGAGGNGSGAGLLGGNGGNGGSWGAGGGAGGNGTWSASLNGKRTGNGGKGGDGVILYRPNL